MNNDTTIKHAVITGAADGIGKALAAVCLTAGYRVTGIDIDAETAAATRAELGAHINFIIADLSDPAVTLDVAHNLKAIDLLIHNAGINEVGTFEQTDMLRQHSVIDLNLTAPLLLTATLFDRAAINDDASIVFISSLSRYVGYPGASVYAATKDGLASYARSLSVAYPDLHVLTVYPGPTRTAHARRYSPDNSREARRMPPAELATRILHAVQQRQRILIPGIGLSLVALVGMMFPRFTRWLMRLTLYDKLAPR